MQAPELAVLEQAVRLVVLGMLAREGALSVPAVRAVAWEQG